MKFGKFHPLFIGLLRVACDMQKRENRIFAVVIFVFISTIIANWWCDAFVCYFFSLLVVERLKERGGGVIRF